MNVKIKNVDAISICHNVKKKIRLARAPEFDKVVLVVLYSDYSLHETFPPTF